MKNPIISLVSVAVVLMFIFGFLTGSNTSFDSQSVTETGGYSDAAVLVSNLTTTQSFTEETMAQEDIKAIVQAGVNTPCTADTPSWHITAVTDETVLEAMVDGITVSQKDTYSTVLSLPTWAAGTQESTKSETGIYSLMLASSEVSDIKTAPLAIVVSCKGGTELDAGLTCQNMSVEAQLLGYGTKVLDASKTAVNKADQELLRIVLGIPDGYSAAAILLIGVADTSSEKGNTTPSVRDSDSFVTYVEP